MIRGSKIELPSKETRNVDVDLNIHNRFDIEVIDAKTGAVKQKAEAYNVVTANYWTRVCGQQAWFSYIHYGRGNGTPTTADKGLFNEINNKAVTGTTVKTFPKEGYAYCRKSIQLGPSDAVGENITEVGIGYDSGTASICTHAMLKDMNGNQISIVKTNTDIINVYATVYVHWNPDGYDNGSINICYLPEHAKSTNVGLMNLLLGLSYTSSYDYGSKRAVFFEGPPTLVAGTTGGVECTIVGNSSNRTLTYTVTRLQVADKNMPTGIHSVGLGGGYEYTSVGTFTYYYQYPMGCITITAPGQGLPGTDITGETVGTGDGSAVNFSTKFPLPSNAHVYVDGVESTDVIIDSNSPGRNVSATNFFEFLQKESDCFTQLFLSNPGFSNAEITDVNARTYLWGNNGYAVFKNPLYMYGIRSFNWMYGDNPWDKTTIQVSDDLITWFDLNKVYPQFNVPEEYIYYKYWRIKFYHQAASSSDRGQYTKLDNYLRANPFHDYSKNIHFTTPPPVGSVITIDYYTPVVAKDDNHVFDLTVTVQLGEYHE